MTLVCCRRCDTCSAYSFRVFSDKAFCESSPLVCFYIRSPYINGIRALTQCFNTGWYLRFRPVVGKSATFFGLSTFPLLYTVNSDQKFSPALSPCKYHPAITLLMTDLQWFVGLILLSMSLWFWFSYSGPSDCTIVCLRHDFIH